MFHKRKLVKASSVNTNSLHKQSTRTVNTNSLHKQSTLTKTEGQEQGTSTQIKGWPGPSSECDQDG